jgi:hypothetical protein
MGEERRRAEGGGQLQHIKALQIEDRRAEEREGCMDERREWGREGERERKKSEMKMG